MARFQVEKRVSYWLTPFFLEYPVGRVVVVQHPLEFEHRIRCVGYGGGIAMQLAGFVNTGMSYSGSGSTRIRQAPEALMG